MALEKGKISASEALLLMMGFMLGTSLLFAPGRGAEQEGWLAVIIGTAEGLIFILIYAALLQRFPGHTLVEIADAVYGPYLGKVISAAFLLSLFLLGVLVASVYNDFTRLNFLPRTPFSAVMLSGVMVAVYVAVNGVEVLARWNLALTYLSLLTLVISSILLLSHFHPQNLLPLFSVPTAKLLWAAHGIGALPFGELVTFTMILPFLNKAKEIRMAAIKAGLYTGAILLMLSIRVIVSLGNTASLYTYPNYQVTRLIEIGEFLTRADIIPGVNYLVLGLVSFSSIFYSVALGTAQLFRLNSYRPLVLPIGLLMGLVSCFAFNSFSESLRFATEVYPLYALPFQLGIPLLTLILAYLRGLPRGGD